MQENATLKKLDSLLVWAVFIVLGVSVYLALTAFLLAIPALLVLLPLKLFLKRKLKE